MIAKASPLLSSTSNSTGRHFPLAEISYTSKFFLVHLNRADSTILYPVSITGLLPFKDGDQMASYL